MAKTLQAIALLAVVVLLPALASSVALAQPYAPRDVSRGVTIPGEGVAGDFDATALSLNPAGLATLGGASFVVGGDILRDQTVRGGGGWAGFAALPIPLIHTAFGLGIQSLDSPVTWTLPGGVGRAEASQFDMGVATGSAHASLGLGWAHLFSDQGPQYAGVDTFHVGLQVRPSRFWAFGATFRDLSGPTSGNAKIERSYDLELSLRPLGDARVEVAGGSLLANDDPDALIDGRGRLVLRLIPGVSLFGQLDSVARRFDGPLAGVSRDERLLFGLTLDSAHSGLSTAAMASASGPDGYVGQSVFARFSAERYPSVIEPARLIRLKLAGHPSDRDFLHTLVWLRQQEKARGVAGLLLLIDGYDVGWGKTEELRDAIAELRAKGKRIFAHLEEGTTRQYYLASACERIYLNPDGGIRLAGAASTHLYYKELFDKLGISFQVVKIAEYKSYPESFTRTSASAPAREEVEVYVNDILSRFGQRVAVERHMSAAHVRELVEQGPYLAPDAKARGLIDELKHPDELDVALRQVLGRHVALVDPARAAVRPWRWSAPQIAVVHVEGDIVGGKNEDVPLWGHVTGGDTVAAAIKSARESPAVRAIVLRVDSPGGAVLPSVQIGREVELTVGKKPIVVSMGDVAASGGYAVAARGDQIFAEPSTITGSIGIFYFKLDVHGLTERLGIHAETIKIGAHADMESPFRPWSAEEERIAQRGIAYFYDRFIGQVATGRKLTKERVNQVGRGRVWTGGMAQPLGLVDRMGGLLAAIDEAKRRAGYSRDDVVDLVQLPHEAENPLKQILKLVSVADSGSANGSDDASATHGETDLLPGLFKRAARWIPPVMVLLGQGALARLPWSPEAVP